MKSMSSSPDATAGIRRGWTCETREGVIKGVQQEYGTINAVYTFLQDQLGVRWLWPGELGEDVPKSERIAISARLNTAIIRRCGRAAACSTTAASATKATARSHEWTMRQRLQL
jgi:hypothetical protein